jgi:TetR/AcrR family transcriptional repressor of nem operon
MMTDIYPTRTAMPRVSRETTDRNRAAIEDAASRLFRERGIDGVSVADLMAAAGLTHGGFYGHFDSKDALAATACAKAFDSANERWRQVVRQHEGEPLAALDALVERYLGPRHRSQPGHGCPAVSLAADVAREPTDKPVRTAYRDGLRGLADQLALLQPDATPQAARMLALAQLAMLSGAVLLSRATEGDAMADLILDAARAHLPTKPVV